MTTLLEAAVATHLALKEQLKAEYALDDDDHAVLQHGDDLVLFADQPIGFDAISSKAGADFGTR